MVPGDEKIGKQKGVSEVWRSPKMNSIQEDGRTGNLITGYKTVLLVLFNYLL